VFCTEKPVRQELFLGVRPPPKRWQPETEWRPLKDRGRSGSYGFSHCRTRARLSSGLAPLWHAG